MAMPMRYSEDMPLDAIVVDDPEALPYLEVPCAEEASPKCPGAPRALPATVSARQGRSRPDPRNLEANTGRQFCWRGLGAATLAGLLFVLASQLSPVTTRRATQVSTMRPRETLDETHQVSKDSSTVALASTEHVMDAAEHPGRAPEQTLFCVSLMQPRGYEKGLLAMQFKEHASIFQCDDYAVYSNERIEVAPHVWTGVVNSTLNCDLGGEFGTALNTGIFLALWAKIISDGQFLRSAWTVKVDPDSVFLPARLRLHLMKYNEEPNGVYLNNCRFGLHGPLEVFSRNAVKTWALGAQSCVEYFTKLCSGPCGWGEDMFIDQCLERKLKVRRENDFRLLLEDHCDPPAGWDDCSNAVAVAFHPFKDLKKWKACLDNTRTNTLLYRKLHG